MEDFISEKTDQLIDVRNFLLTFEEPIFLVLDDFQVTYDDVSFCENFFKNFCSGSRGQLYCLLSATHSIAYRSLISPVFDNPAQGFGFSDLQLSIEEIDEYLRHFDSRLVNFCTKSGCFRDEQFLNVIKNACGRHVGALHQITFSLFERLKNSDDPNLVLQLTDPNFVNVSMARLFGIHLGQFPSDLRPAEIQVLRNILTSPLSSIRQDSLALEHLAAVQDLVKFGIIVVDDTGACGFSFPFARTVFFRKIFPDKGSQTFASTEIDKFIETAIGRFDRARLISSCGASATVAFPKEAFFQQEFYRCAVAVLDPKYQIIAEMSKIFRTRGASSMLPMFFFFFLFDLADFWLAQSKSIFSSTLICVGASSS
jgi:hypothetical protein